MCILSIFKSVSNFWHFHRTCWHSFLLAQENKMVEMLLPLFQYVLFVPLWTVHYGALQNHNDVGGITYLRLTRSLNIGLRLSQLMPVLHRCCIGAQSRWTFLLAMFQPSHVCFSCEGHCLAMQLCYQISVAVQIIAHFFWMPNVTKCIGCFYLAKHIAMVSKAALIRPPLWSGSTNWKWFFHLEDVD